VYGCHAGQRTGESYPYDPVRGDQIELSGPEAVQEQTALVAAGGPGEIVIRPPGRWGVLRLKELLGHRELLYFLTRRELLVRYKQSLFGIAWAVLQPLAMMGIFSIFFGRLAGVPSDGIPYPLFALAGLVPWMFVSQAVSQSAVSLVADSNILSKVYFPRLVIPTGRVLAMLADLAIALVVLVVVMALYGVAPEPTVFVVPALIVLAFVIALAAGTIFAVLNVRYRDVTVAVPLLMQLWLFSTPVVYPSSLITGGWEYVYALNPVVSVVAGVRWALLGTPGPSLGAVAVSCVAAGALLVIALVYFRRTERFFADVI
jgi:lipopolysaccharide transport system permease protein